MGINRTPDKKSRSQIKGFRAIDTRLINLKLNDERKNPTIILRRGVFNCAYSFSILIQGLKDECIISIFSIKLTVPEAPEKSRNCNWPQTHTDAHRHYWVKLERAQSKDRKSAVTEFIGLN